MHGCRVFPATALRFALLSTLCVLAACSEPAAPEVAGRADLAVPAASARVDVDAVLQRYLAGALQRVASPQCLREDQQQWLARMRDACVDDAQCMDAWRARRARELEALLPGALLERGGWEAGAATLPPQLLAVVGMPGDAQERAQMEAVEIDGRPREDEGGYLLVGEDFDAATWDTLNQLMGDEAALRARFGDGPVLVQGLAGSMPGLLLDVGDRAAIDSVAAAGGRLRVRGWAWASSDEAPAISPDQCVYLYSLDPVPR